MICSVFDLMMGTAALLLLLLLMTLMLLLLALMALLIKVTWWGWWPRALVARGGIVGSENDESWWQW